MLKTHKPVPISEKVTQPALCPLHGEKLKYYCILCAKLICADCERDPSACKGHEALLLSEAATKKRAYAFNQVATPYFVEISHRKLIAFKQKRKILIIC